MEIRLDGKAALVSGASMGIGLAIAEEFATSGADVAMIARRLEPLEKAAANIAERTGRKTVAIRCDVRNADQVEDAFAQATQAFGRIDILVNNAGTSNAHPFMEVTDEQWQEDLDLKLFAAIRFIRLAWPGMKERQYGRIINVLNTGAKAPRPASAPTSVTRAAGMALTKALAGEYAPHNVLINAMLVGQIVSDQWVRRHKAQGANVPFEEFTAKQGANIPLGRMGTAEEFANLACFLASDAAGFITGTAINVDGGASPVV